MSEARKISAAQMCRALSENPARLYGLYPRKGVLRSGSDADIVVYDPGASHVIRAEDCVANVDYNPYEGFVTAGGSPPAASGRCGCGDSWPWRTAGSCRRPRQAGIWSGASALCEKRAEKRRERSLRFFMPSRAYSAASGSSHRTSTMVPSENSMYSLLRM